MPENAVSSHPGLGCHWLEQIKGHRTFWRRLEADYLINPDETHVRTRDTPGASLQKDCPSTLPQALVRTHHRRHLRPPGVSRTALAPGKVAWLCRNDPVPQSLHCVT